jgi:uncharacterized protein YcbK (DUF882 family)
MSSADYKIVPHGRHITRRRVLQWGAVGLFSAAVPDLGFARGRKFCLPERSLSFCNTHTGEELEVVYWSRGKYRKQALADIDHILRDHRTGEVKAINTRLLDLAHDLGERLGNQGPFHIISGYRSAKTNALLRTAGHGVAGKSLHLQGKALDVRMPGTDLPVVHRAAVDLKGGGVGYYPGPDFVHIDVGRVRYW